MNKNKKIFVIISTILAIITFVFSSQIYKILSLFTLFNMYSTVEYSAPPGLGYIILSLSLIIVPILSLIKYIFVIKNSEKYFDISKLEKTLIFTNIVVIIIETIDFFYNLFFISKLSSNSNYFSVFLITYLPLFETIYIMLIIWMFLLKKKRIKNK